MHADDLSRSSDVQPAPVVVGDAEPVDLNADGSISVREKVVFYKRIWSVTPRPVRRGLVAVVGSTLVLLGLALVVLPGPFTLPLVVAGFAVLGTEFAWASHVLRRGRHHVARAGSAMRSRFRRRSG